MVVQTSRREDFLAGIRDGIPIALGYLAVGFSVGIACRNAGLDAFQGFLISILNMASAGEYAGLVVIAAQSGYIEVALITLVTNARYFLMSCALSQRFPEGMPFYHRLLMGFGVTDELFGIAISRPGFVKPFYSYGAFSVAAPGWSFGTMFGVIAGTILPLRLVSALSVALFGMFLAVIIPPAKQNKAVALFVALSFICSFSAQFIDFFAAMSGGTRTIVLTVVLSAAAALLFPIPKQEETEGPHHAE